MNTTDNLGLKITTDLTFATDDVKETILSYGANFEILDEVFGDSVSDMESLTVGRNYEYGKRLWNKNPEIGGYVGWVNIREGVYAKQWVRMKNYAIGELVSASPTDNGNIYRCVQDGRASVSPPNFLVSDGAELYDPQGLDWQQTFNYEVNDVIFSTDGNKLFYYVCETAGLSSMTEPEWVNTEVGSTLIDGSVVWRKEKAVKWQQVASSCNFRPFGKID